MKKLIVILGPTASGKTEMAIRLAKKFNGEIVSADSRQIYKYMNIGTSKPAESFQIPLLPFKKEERFFPLFKGELRGISEPNVEIKKPLIINNIPHYLINIINPDEEFSLAQYKKLAIEFIKDIQKRNKIPFLAGGTGLYISAVVDNLIIPKAKPDEVMRNKLEEKSNIELFEELKKIDPIAAKNIDIENKRRLIRAVEVIRLTGELFSKQQKKGKPLFDILQIGIEIPRSELYRRIEKRVDKMIKNGLEQEVRNLIKKGYRVDLPSMSGLGYRQMIMYLKNEINLSGAVELIKRDTRRYARRQMTWLRRDKRIKWIENYKETEELVEGFLT